MEVWKLPKYIRDFKFNKIFSIFFPCSRSLELEYILLLFKANKQFDGECITALLSESTGKGPDF